jgi:hypothetical protein
VAMSSHASSVSPSLSLVIPSPADKIAGGKITTTSAIRQHALVQQHPHDEELLSNLTAGLAQLDTDVEGPRSQFYKTLKQEVERVLSEPATPPEVHTWLREVLGRLEQTIPRQIVWEYDRNVEDLYRYIQDKNSAQRMWAIGRVLKFARMEDVTRLLTVTDIAEALPQVDLPEKKRQMLEKAVEVWRHDK